MLDYLAVLVVALHHSRFSRDAEAYHWHEPMPTDQYAYLDTYL